MHRHALFRPGEFTIDFRNFSNMDTLEWGKKYWQKSVLFLPCSQGPGAGGRGGGRRGSREAGAGEKCAGTSHWFLNASV